MTVCIKLHFYVMVTLLWQWELLISVHIVQATASLVFHVLASEVFLNPSVTSKLMDLYITLFVSQLLPVITGLLQVCEYTCMYFSSSSVCVKAVWGYFSSRTRGCRARVVKLKLGYGEADCKTGLVFRARWKYWRCVKRPWSFLEQLVEVGCSAFITVCLWGRVSTHVTIGDHRFVALLFTNFGWEFWRPFWCWRWQRVSTTAWVISRPCFLWCRGWPCHYGLLIDLLLWRRVLSLSDFRR